MRLSATVPGFLLIVRVGKRGVPLVGDCNLGQRLYHR
jgi:UDP-N-acetylglucosamine enolpyruvyl transferase